MTSLFTSANQAQNFFKSAQDKMKQSISVDPTEVAELLDQALKIDPELWQARLWLAKLYQSLGDFHNAHQHLIVVVAFHHLKHTSPTLKQYLQKEFASVKERLFLQDYAFALEKSFAQKTEKEVRQIFDKVSAGLARTSSKEIVAKLKKISGKKWEEYDRQIEKELNQNLELEAAKRELERPSTQRSREVSFILVMPVALLLLFIKQKGAISWPIVIPVCVIVGFIAWKIGFAPKTAKKQLELARTMMIKNSIPNPYQVATYLAKALKEDPNLWQARLLRAQLYHSLGGVLLAMKELTVVVGFHQLNHTTTEFNLYLKQEHAPLFPDDLHQLVQDLEKSFAKKEEGEIIKIMETEQAILDLKAPANILEDTRENQETRAFEQSLKKPTKKYSSLKRTLLRLGFLTPLIVLIIFKIFHITPIQSEYRVAIGGIIFLIWVLLYYNIIRYL